MARHHSHPRASKLAKLVQSLPRELYDEIYKLTFTADADKVVDLENEHAFPKLLHINRHSRKRFAHSYFTNTTFTLKYEEGKDLTFIDRWLGGLSEKHISLVSNLLIKIDMLVLDTSDHGAYVNEQKIAAYGTMNTFFQDVFRDWFEPPAQAVRIQVWPGWQEGLTTETMYAFAHRLRATPAALRLTPRALNLRGTLDGESV